MTKESGRKGFKVMVEERDIPASPSTPGFSAAYSPKLLETRKEVGKFGKAGETIAKKLHFDHDDLLNGVISTELRHYFKVHTTPASNPQKELESVIERNKGRDVDTLLKAVHNDFLEKHFGKEMISEKDFIASIKSEMKASTSLATQIPAAISGIVSYLTKCTKPAGVEPPKKEDKIVSAFKKVILDKMRATTAAATVSRSESAKAVGTPTAASTKPIRGQSV